MKIIELTEVRQFEELSKGDLLLIEWNDYFVKHTQNSKKVMLYKVKEIKLNTHEVILKAKGNHFFNYHLYLGLVNSKSDALDVKLVIYTKLKGE